MNRVLSYITLPFAVLFFLLIIGIRVITGKCYYSDMQEFLEDLRFFVEVRLLNG